MSAFLWIAFAAVSALILAFSRRGLRDPDGSPFPTMRAERPSSHSGERRDVRRHRRFVPSRRATTLHLQDGRQIPARIIDASVAGVAIEASLTDADFVSIDRVGTRLVGPVRRTRTAAVFRFATFLDPLEIDRNLVL